MSASAHGRNGCARVALCSLLVAAVGCAPDSSISSWSGSLAADATAVYWIDRYVGIRAFRASTGRIENLARADDTGTTSFNNLKLSDGRLFWSAVELGVSYPPPVVMYAMPASGGTPVTVLRLNASETVVAFDVLGDVLYVYVERDDPGQIVWSLREVSISTGASTDVQLGSATPPPNSTGIGRQGQQVLATGANVFYLLWEPQSLHPTDSHSLSVFRLSSDGTSERLGNTVPPSMADNRLSVTSDAAYWLGPDANTIQAVPLTGGTVRTVLTLPPRAPTDPFPVDRFCTIAASATQLFAFRCLAPASGFYSDFWLMRVDPLRGTATETLRRRASFVRAFTAAEDVQYWFEESTSAIVPRLRSSE